MNRSRAELAAHLAKAARGARLPLAVAEDLYAAAPFLTPEDTAWIVEDIMTGGIGLIGIASALDAVECGAGPMPDTIPAAAFAAARGWRSRPPGWPGWRGVDPPTPLAGPVEVADALWDRLETFAARTYVPETADSRVRGAGAGEIDND